MKTIEELKQFTYRQLQTECKAHGISAKGKADELLGKLIANLDAPVPAKESKKASAPSRKSTKKAEPATVATSKTKSMDEAIVKKALNTPLPKTPARPRKDSNSQKKRSKAPFFLGALTALLTSAFIALVVIPHCQQHDCQLQAQQAYLNASQWTAVKSDQAISWTKQNTAHLATVAQGHIAHLTAASQQTLGPAVDTLNVYTADVKHRLSLLLLDLNNRFRSFQFTSAVKEMLSSMTSRIHTRAASSTSSPGSQQRFQGQLNTAVLDSLLRKDDGASWESLRQDLADVWAGRKIAQEKANTVMFTCSSPSTCDYGLEELSAAAPREDTLVFHGSSLAQESKGTLQQQLATFLKDHPSGVVIISSVDKVPLSLIPVLSNGMGEYGGFQMDGESVAASSATFFLLYEVPPGIMAQENGPSLSLSSKTSLAMTLRDGHDAEESTAAAEAFVRRIDIVAPMADRS